MYDQLLNALKYLLLALIYLFFGRVLWAVWAEVRTPGSSRAGTSRRARTPKGAVSFVVIEPRHHRGRSYTLSNVLGIGRDDDNEIVIDDDSFISGHHARIEVRPDGTAVVDLGSTNGTFVNGQRVNGERAMRKGDRLQVGSTVLEMKQ